MYNKLKMEYIGIVVIVVIIFVFIGTAYTYRYFRCLRNSNDLNEKCSLCGGSFLPNFPNLGNRN
jgi:predicted Na+-dependent transporter